MFTKEHYIEISKVMRESNPDYDIIRDNDVYLNKKGMWFKVLEKLIDMFEEDNKRFNKDKFINNIHNIDYIEEKVINKRR